MFPGTDGKFRSTIQPFNMTPVVDIVFLLIIFFLVVCQFIEAENFPVRVPDGCQFAMNEDQDFPGAATVTVMKTAGGKSEFAVGSEKIEISGDDDIVDRLAELIDLRLKNLPPDQRIVTLRIDRDVRFERAQL